MSGNFSLALATLSKRGEIKWDEKEIQNGMKHSIYTKPVPAIYVSQI